MSRAAKPPRVWQRMLSGRRLDILDPSPLDIEIEDIAHGLARVARWNGQTRGDHAFSVAQHSLIVEGIVAAQEPDPQCRLAALLHDGPEYVIGDMISPFKGVLGHDYKAIEKRLQRAIHLRFALAPDLPPGLEKRIKKADRLSAHHEAVLLAGFSRKEAAALFGAANALDESLFEPLSARAAQAAYIERFHEIEALARSHKEIQLSSATD